MSQRILGHFKTFFIKTTADLALSEITLECVPHLAVVHLKHHMKVTVLKSCSQGGVFRSIDVAMPLEGIIIGRVLSSWTVFLM